MTNRVVRLIKEKGEAIVCEAEVGKEGKHSGMILFEHDGHREVLGRTDPTFESADEAVRVMEKAVKTVRGSKSEKSVNKKKASSRKKKGV